MSKLRADGWSDTGRQVEDALEIFRLLFIGACADVVEGGGRHHAKLTTITNRFAKVNYVLHFHTNITVCGLNLSVQRWRCPKTFF